MSKDKKIEHYWMIPKNEQFADMLTDLTEYFSLIRKLNGYGFSESILKTMVFSAFHYDKPKNNLSKEIEMWHLSGVNRLIQEANKE